MTKLNWNNQGQIGCEKHIPFVGSDTWTNENWKQIPFVVTTENNLKCEVCR